MVVPAVGGPQKVDQTILNTQHICNNAWKLLELYLYVSHVFAGPMNPGAALKIFKQT